MHRHVRTRFARTAAAVGVAALALTACQTVDEDAIRAQAYTDETLEDPVEPVGPGGALVVEGFEWGFEIVEGVAIDGDVEVTFVNTGGTVHNFRIDEAAGEQKKVEANAGQEDTGVLKLFGPVEYTYYCDIPGHRAQGMVGTLTVYASEEEAQEAEEEPAQGQDGGDDTDEGDDVEATESPTEDG